MTSTEPERKRKRKKAAIIGITGALVIAGGLAAYAYWTASGTGTGDATHATPISVGFVQDAAITNLSPANTTPTNITGHITFTGNVGKAYVGTIVPAVGPITGGGVGAGAACSADDYTLTNGGFNAEAIADGAGTTANSVTFGTIVFNDTSLNQDKCKGATVNLTFTAA